MELYLRLVERPKLILVQTLINFWLMANQLADQVMQEGKAEFRHIQPDRWHVERNNFNQ